MQSIKKQEKKWNKNWLFNCLRAFSDEGYQGGSLGKSHENSDYQKQAMQKSCLPQDSNMQPLKYQSSALSKELRG